MLRSAASGKDDAFCYVLSDVPSYSFHFDVIVSLSPGFPLISEESNRSSDVRSDTPDSGHRIAAFLSRD